MHQLRVVGCQLLVGATLGVLRASRQEVLELLQQGQQLPFLRAQQVPVAALHQGGELRTGASFSRCCVYGRVVRLIWAALEPSCCEVDLWHVLSSSSFPSQTPCGHVAQLDTTRICALAT